MSKITWSDQQSMAQQAAGLTDSASLTKFKRDMQVGASKFMARLGREYTRNTITMNLVANQQYYPLPVDAFKLKEMTVSTGTYIPPMEQIPDEFAWNMMNMLTITGQPTHYFVRVTQGYTEIGLYPTPANNVTNGIVIAYSSRHVEMTQNDFSTGTIAINNNSKTLTHSATGFTAKMVGQYFQNTDGTDENWYKIAAFVSTSQLTLQSAYQGANVTASAFRIGQVMDLPEEYLEAPVDYALYRHYLRRGDTGKAAEFKALWDEALTSARDAYGNVTESQVIAAEPQFRVYNPFRGDPPAAISA